MENDQNLPSGMGNRTSEEKRMNVLKKWALLLTALCLAVTVSVGCSQEDVDTAITVIETVGEIAEAVGEMKGEASSAPSADASTSASSDGSSSVEIAPPGGDGPSQPETSAEPEEEALDPDGTYTTAEDVSLYLWTYGELPDNFITKNEARSLGWEGGSLEPYAPGKCIGGARFGNYEELLPPARKYRECDIDTLGATKRGAKRLVFSDDLIYYTEDHYESFTLLYGEE